VKRLSIFPATLCSSRAFRRVGPTEARAAVERRRIVSRNQHDSSGANDRTLLAEPAESPARKPEARTAGQPALGGEAARRRRRTRERRTASPATTPAIKAFDKDPAVIFAGRFRSTPKPTACSRRWDNFYQQSGTAFSTSGDTVFARKQSLEFTGAAARCRAQQRRRQADQAGARCLVFALLREIPGSVRRRGLEPQRSSISAHYFNGTWRRPAFPADGMNKFLVKPGELARRRGHRITRGLERLRLPSAAARRVWRPLFSDRAGHAQHQPALRFRARFRQAPDIHSRARAPGIVTSTWSRPTHQAKKTAALPSGSTACSRGTFRIYGCATRRPHHRSRAVVVSHS